MHTLLTAFITLGVSPKPCCGLRHTWPDDLSSWCSGLLAAATTNQAGFHPGAWALLFLLLGCPSHLASLTVIAWISMLDSLPHRDLLRAASGGSPSHHHLDPLVFNALSWIDTPSYLYVHGLTLCTLCLCRQNGSPMGSELSPVLLAALI